MQLITQTEQIWMDQGLQKGMQQGLQQGMQQGLQRAIELALKRRFGQPGLDLLPRVKTISDAPALESFFEAVETAPDLDSVRKLLPPQA